jgi:hypothetical protein
MRRRTFITLHGGTAAWPLVASARNFFALLGTLIFWLGTRPWCPPNNRL